MTSAVMGSVAGHRVDAASAILNTSRQLGGVFGIALLGEVITSAFHRAVEANLTRQGLTGGAASLSGRVGGSEATSGRVTVHRVMNLLPPGTPRSVTQTAVAAVHESFVHAIHVGMMVGIALALLASLISFSYVRTHVHDEEEPQRPVAHVIG